MAERNWGGENSERDLFICTTMGKPSGAEPPLLAWGNRDYLTEINVACRHALLSLTKSDLDIGNDYTFQKTRF